MDRATPSAVHGGRDWVVRAYARALGRLFAALVVTFLLYLPVARELFPVVRPGAAKWARLFGFEVVQPYAGQFVAFAVSRLASPLVGGPFLVAGIVALVVVARRRSE
ncbi:hypothetical protein [Halosimplex sp. J119]